MKKRLILVIALFFVLTLAACARRFDNVESIQLNWTPSATYDISSEPEINISARKVTIEFDGSQSSRTVELTDDDVEVSGDIIIQNGDIFLDTLSIGLKEVIVSSGGLSIEFFYYVEDGDWLEDINYIFENSSRADSHFLNCILGAAQCGNELTELNNPSNLVLSYFIPEDLLDYYEFWYASGSGYSASSQDGTSISGFSADIFVTRDGLGEPFTSTYQAQQVIITALTHRIKTAEGRVYVQQLDALLNQGTFESIDWDQLIANLLDSYVSAPEEMNYTTGGVVYPKELLIVYYNEMLNGGDQALPTEWPGFLNLSPAIDLEVAQFLNNVFGSNEPAGYSQVAGELQAFIDDFLED